MYLTKRQELLYYKQQFDIIQKQVIQEFLKAYGYVYEKDISRGHFCLVVQAKSIMDDNCKVAIKILNYEHNSKIDFEKLNKQVEFLNNLKEEKYILQFVEKIQELTYDITALVTEYCETNLAQILNLSKLTIEQVYALAYQLLKGLLLFQEKKKVLRYIEPEKIFYSVSKNQFLLSYISYSKLIYCKNDEQLGNLSYQSPEVIDKKKPYTIAQNIEIQDIEHQNFSKQEQLVQKVQNKKKQVKQNKISDDEEEQEMYQNKQVKFDQIENENKQIKNTINQQIQPAIEISQSPQIIKGGKKTQYYTQIQQDIKQNKQTEITELPQIQITNNNSGEQKVTYMEIEQENNKKVKKSVDKKQKKNKNDKNKQLDQDINNEAQNCIIQVDIKQLILNQILMSQIKKNEIQIQKYNDCLRQNPQVQNDLKQLIQQLKQKKQYISKNQVDNFHIEDYQPFYENYEDEYDKEIKIIDIKNIPQQKNYGVVEIELKYISAIEEEILKLGEFLQKCQKMRFLTLNVEFVHNEGEKYIGNFIGQCKNLCFLKLKLNVSNTLDSIFSDVVKRVPYISKRLSQCQNLVNLDLYLSLCQLAQGYLKFANYLQNCKSIITLQLHFRSADMSFQDLKHILISLESLQYMKFLKLDLSSNELNGIAYENELEGIRYKSLTDLTLDIPNNLSQQQLNKIIRSFKSCENLNSLHIDLRGNNFKRGSQANEICFYELKNLTHLSLISAFFQINNEDLDYIGLNLQKCQNLNSLKLDLSDSQIRQKGLNFISQGLEKCKNLSSLSLDLSRNKLSIEAVSSITAILNDHLDIKNLSLSLSFSIVVEAQSKIDQNRVAIEILNNDQIQKINHKKLEKCKQILENFTDDKYFIQFVQSIEDLEYGNVAIVTQIYEKIIIQCKEEEVKQEYQQLLETENLLETEQQNTKQENIQKKGQVKQEEQNLLQAYSQFVKDYKQANKLIDQDEGVSQTPQYEKQNLFKNTNLKS
ncbi:hypothetical protein ABPG72_007594, partial [Tetrahymena utriculariae]